MARFTAFLDACVIVPLAPCDTMLRMADAGAFRPVWSQNVLDEALRALERIHPDVDASRFQSRFRSMNEAFDDALVEGWEPLAKGIELPDPNDAHVVAAALLGRADLIVTENVKDFPDSVLVGLRHLSLREPHGEACTGEKPNAHRGQALGPVLTCATCSAGRGLRSPRTRGRVDRVRRASAP
ncbi:MAG: PIN domain-containing protein [Actinobacteria bacterium]|nr:PIN domain-containing protein [Actinomycetota bacterium]